MGVEAVPDESATGLPIEVPLSVNVTVPVGVAPVPLIVAVKVTLAPKPDGFNELESAVELASSVETPPLVRAIFESVVSTTPLSVVSATPVVPEPTVSGIADEELDAKLVSPLYDATTL